MATGNPTETLATEFCYKGVNLSLEELNTRAVQIAKFPEISHFFNLHNSFGRHENATSRKSLEIQAWSITKPQNQDSLQSENLYQYILVFRCSDILKIKS